MAQVWCRSRRRRKIFTNRAIAKIPPGAQSAVKSNAIVARVTRLIGRTCLSPALVPVHRTRLLDSSFFQKFVAGRLSWRALPNVPAALSRGRALGKALAGRGGGDRNRGRGAAPARRPLPEHLLRRICVI